MEEDGGRRGAGGLGGLGALGPMGGIGGSGGMGTLSPYLNVDTSYLQSESPEFIFNQVSHSIIILGKCFFFSSKALFSAIFNSPYIDEISGEISEKLSKNDQEIVFWATSDKISCQFWEDSGPSIKKLMSV